MTRGRPRGSGNIPWASIVTRLREQPGRWMLVPEMRRVNGRTIQVIRKQERRALRLDDGVIRCRSRNTFVLDGVVICTLYLKFDPKEKHATAQKDAEPHAE